MKHSIITSAVLLILTLSMLFSCLYIASSTCNKFTSVTQANYNYSSHIPPLRVSSLERFGVRISHNFVSFCCEGEETQIKEHTIVPVLTNHSFFNLSNIKLSGDGITQVHIENKNKVAVISKDLAVKLFFTTECIGRKLTLNNADYIVNGVYYPENKSPLNILSRDSSERVYIPYTCDENYTQREIQTLIYDNNSRSTPLIGQICVSQYHLTNLYEKERVIESLVHLILLFIFLITSGVVLYLRSALLKRLTGEIRRNLSTHYFTKSLISIPHKYLLYLLAGVIIPVLIILVFIKADFSIYIVSKYIPQDYLFDISSYIKSIADNAMHTNSLSLTGNTYLPVLYSKTFDTVAILCLLTVGLFTGFVCSIRHFLKLLSNKIKSI